jgi:hypothetical protein
MGQAAPTVATVGAPVQQPGWGEAYVSRTRVSNVAHQPRQLGLLGTNIADQPRAAPTSAPGICHAPMSWQRMLRPEGEQAEPTKRPGGCGKPYYGRLAIRPTEHPITTAMFSTTLPWVKAP